MDRENTIIAIPRMTEAFHALDDIGWYGQAYLLTTWAFDFTYLQVLHPFQHQVGLLARNYMFRGWVCDLRLRADFDGTHCRPSNCWSWGFRYFFLVLSS